MGRGDPKARAKRNRSRWAKAAPPGIPELSPSNLRQPNGQARERADQPKDPRKTVLTARCVQMGIEPTRESRREMSAAHLEHPLGRVMAFRCTPQEITSLWGTFRSFNEARRRFEMRILGITGEPKGMSLNTKSEEHGDDVKRDPRTPDELDEAAKAAWAIWEARLDELSERELALLNGGGPMLYSTQWRQPTAAGLATLDALKALHAVATRKQ